MDVSVHLDERGEVICAFKNIRFSKRISWLLTEYASPRRKERYLRLRGKSADGTKIKSDRFSIDAANIAGETTIEMEIRGTCLTAEFIRPLAQSVDLPVMRLHMCGLAMLQADQVVCPFGTVSACGLNSVADRELLGGCVTLHATSPPRDLAKWRREGEALLEHVRRVLSVGAASLIKAPATEFFFGSENRVLTYAQTRRGQALPTMRTMHMGNLVKPAVESFFKPPVEVQRLYFSIEWFCMDASSYNEVRLTCAMTALETLMDANLGPGDVLIQRAPQFKKSKRAIRSLIQKCVNRWEPADAHEVMQDMEEKLADLNRRSLARKLRRLLSLWNVPMNGIETRELELALKARNRVIHKGQYYEDPETKDPDLWDHVCLIREVLVRIFFTVIGYCGPYTSYVPRPRDAQFPPR